jgi:cyclase
MSTSHSDEWPLGRPKVEEVSEGVFAYIQPDGSWFINNMGFLVGRDGVVSIDTSSTERRTRAYLEAIAHVTDRPVRTLINTHHHPDHTHGNCFLPLASTIGHPLCREEILRTPLGPLAAVFQPVEWGDVRPAPPFVTFDDHLTVWVDDLRVELYAIGTPAHTTNDVIAWIPERSVLFTGDLVFVGGSPFVLAGSVAGSLAALERLRSFGARTLIPGHGPVSGPEVIDDARDYLQFLQRTAENARAAGLSPLEAARQTELGSFAELHEPERIVGNLHRAYADLDGKQVDLVAALKDMVTYNGGQPLRCLA